MPVIDFHNHYYPPKYMQALQSGQSSVKVTIDEKGNPNLHYPGDYNVAVRGHRDLAYREEVLDAHRVTMQVSNPLKNTEGFNSKHEPPRKLAETWGTLTPQCCKSVNRRPAPKFKHVSVGLPLRFSSVRRKVSVAVSPFESQDELLTTVMR